MRSVSLVAIMSGMPPVHQAMHEARIPDMTVGDKTVITVEDATRIAVDLLAEQLAGLERSAGFLNDLFGFGVDK